MSSSVKLVFTKKPKKKKQIEDDIIMNYKVKSQFRIKNYYAPQSLIQNPDLLDIAIYWGS